MGVARRGAVVCLISVVGVAGAAWQTNTLVINPNGTSTSLVSAPGTTVTSGDLASFNGTSGTAIQDSGLPASSKCSADRSSRSAVLHPLNPQTFTRTGPRCERR